MQSSFGAATLIYIGQTKASNGSPVMKSITLPNVKVKEIRTFSLNYYTSRPTSRQMRKSRNLVVDKKLTFDRTDDDGVVYELMFVEYQGTRFTVREVLHYFKRDTAMVLDCEETR